MTTHNTLDSKQDDALKPCPFCGASAFTSWDGDVTAPNDWSVNCDNTVGCGATVGGTSSEAEAIKAWNRRASVAAVEGEAEKEFLAASVAVWREIDQLSALPEGYKGLPPETDPRKRELAAWEKYRSVLDSAAASSSAPAEPPPVSNHVFTCAGCGRQWTVDSTDSLECFFVGVCYWCIRQHRLTKDQIDGHLRSLLPSPASATPSDAAMRAAEEIIEYGESVKWGQGRQPMYAMEIAAIITRHLAAMEWMLSARTIELERQSCEAQKWNNRANQLAIEIQDLRRRVDGEDSSLNWLGYAKSELECHAEWWRQMYQPHFQARARQASAMIEDIDKVIAATTTSPETPEFPKCVKCGHDDGVDENGVCRNTGYDPNTTSCLCHGCICKCEFASPETPVGGEPQKRNEDGELTSICKHCGQPISQTVSTGSWYHDLGWSRMCTRLNAAPVVADDEHPNAAVKLAEAVMGVLGNSRHLASNVGQVKRRVRCCASYSRGRGKVRRLIFFLLGIRECDYCHGICGDWKLLDNTYPHADDSDYLRICIRCYNNARNLPIGPRPENPND